MKKWSKIPESLKNDQSFEYFKILKKKWLYRLSKRCFDFIASLILVVLLFLPSLIIGIVICCDSKGGPFFCQERIGRFGKHFKIIKFRTMKKNSEGNQHITHKNDSRITKVGAFLRKTHLDEFPQVLNVFCGQMSFVGTRPEVEQFVLLYKDDWKATLFMRPGITSTASYSYDDEAKDLAEGNADELYITLVLPKKMNNNLLDIKEASCFRDVKILWKTLF